MVVRGGLLPAEEPESAEGWIVVDGAVRKRYVLPRLGDVAAGVERAGWVPEQLSRVAVGHIVLLEIQTFFPYAVARFAESGGSPKSDSNASAGSDVATSCSSEVLSVGLHPEATESGRTHVRTIRPCEPSNRLRESTR